MQNFAVLPLGEGGKMKIHSRNRRTKYAIVFVKSFYEKKNLKKFKLNKMNESADRRLGQLNNTKKN